MQHYPLHSSSTSIDSPLCPSDLLTAHAISIWYHRPPRMHRLRCSVLHLILCYGCQARLTTLNNRMDSLDKHIAGMEKSQSDTDGSGISNETARCNRN